MDPLLSIQIYHDPPVYRPGDEMRFDFQIDAIEMDELAAVEASVLWVTEGKGDEDLGVHFFERRVPSDEEGDLRSLRTCNVTLPNSPLSYQGELLEIRWSVRVRIFAKGGREFCTEKPFVLSTTATPAQLECFPMNRRAGTLLAPHNPFATKFIRAGALAYRFSIDESIGQLHARLSLTRWRGQIVGPHGSGKTTLLRTLDRFWADWNRDPVTYTLRNGQRFLPNHRQAARWHRGTLVIIDGYEQLCWMARLMLQIRCRKARCGLLVTTHRATMLPIILETKTNLGLAHDLVNELLANNSAAKLTSREIEDSFAQTKGNLRETFLSLYDVYRR